MGDKQLEQHKTTVADLKQQKSDVLKQKAEQLDQQRREFEDLKHEKDEVVQKSADLALEKDIEIAKLQGQLAEGKKKKENTRVHKKTVQITQNYTRSPRRLVQKRKRSLIQEFTSGAPYQSIGHYPKEVLQQILRKPQGKEEETRILVVGEMDFSFSKALSDLSLQRLGGQEIVATSFLDRKTIKRVTGGGGAMNILALED